MLVKLGVQARGDKPITERTVRTWCEKVAEDMHRRGVAANVYDTMFTDEESLRFSNLQSDRERQALALNSLALFVRPNFSRFQNSGSSEPQKPS